LRLHVWCLIAALTHSGSAFAQEEAGRPCDKDFMNTCPEGQECIELRCQIKKKPVEIREEVAAEAKPSSDRGFRLGVQNSFFIGFAGRFHNPEPAYSVALDFGFPTGRSATWHVEVGYLDLNGYTGLKFNPFLLGYTVPLLNKPVRLELEVVLAIVQTEVLFGNGYAIALSSGLRSQLVLVYGIGWVGFSPLGFEIRYAYGTEGIGIDTGAGANWPMMLTVGIEL
jgi:hypothetical protein